MCHVWTCTTCSLATPQVSVPMHSRPDTGKTHPALHLLRGNKHHLGLGLGLGQGTDMHRPPATSRAPAARRRPRRAVRPTRVLVRRHASSLGASTDSDDDHRGRSRATRMREEWSSADEIWGRLLGRSTYTRDSRGPGALTHSHMTLLWNRYKAHGLRLRCKSCARLGQKADHHNRFQILEG